MQKLLASFCSILKQSVKQTEEGNFEIPAHITGRRIFAVIGILN